VSQSQGDGLDEAVGGAVRVAVTVAGQVVEQSARAREARQREEQARLLAETHRQQAREGATAAAVVAADVAREQVDELHRAAVERGDGAPSPRDGWDTAERRAALEERLSTTVPDSEAVAARLHVDRSQATPPEAAVAKKATRPTKARSSRGPGPGKQRERDGR
jgi:hypothetical protein